MKARAHIKVTGRVQGVYYRSTAREVAIELGLTGWVRNVPDGSVEIVAEGEKEKIEEFIKWCWKGPPLAIVKNLEVKWEEYKNEFKSFEVRYR
jgi:acylphosphatase